MGLTTLPTNQFWNRILLFFMEVSKYTEANQEPFIENVKTWRIHLYTGIQLFLFSLLYAIKSIKPIAIAFPIIIASCIPIRLYLLPKIFTCDELTLLDSGDDALVDEWLDEHGRTRRTKVVEVRQRYDDEIYHQSIQGSSYGGDNSSIAPHSIHTI
jgi:hypothetical protein